LLKAGVSRKRSAQNAKPSGFGLIQLLCVLLEYSGSNSWNYNFNNDNVNNNNRNNNNYVRAVRGFSEAWAVTKEKSYSPFFRRNMSQYSDFSQNFLFSELCPYITDEDMYNAYYDCRKHKRNSPGALEFELNYEHNLAVLKDEINNGTYKPGNYSAFIVPKPTPREIFAAEFRDRIVHHLVVNRINPYLEKRLIYDVYACRIGKGTHVGIKRLRRFMTACTENYTKEAWCLKLDLKSFFASIDRELLWKRLKTYLEATYNRADKAIILRLVKEIVLKKPTEGAIRKSPLSMWEILPPHKSLFNAKKNHGLPIGNLTSQIFANFLLSPLDHFVKHDLGIRYYGRYVDDFFLIHQDKEYLKACLKKIEQFLINEIGVSLNPRKVILQRVRHGVKFLGVIVSPGRMVNIARTEKNFEEVVNEYNKKAKRKELTKEEKQEFFARINSYLGIMGHYDTYKKRQAITDQIDRRIMFHFATEPDLKKITRR
jgi:RNA-directed DNA polymerase